MGLKNMMKPLKHSKQKKKKKQVGLEQNQMNMTFLLELMKQKATLKSTRKLQTICSSGRFNFHYEKQQ